MDEIILKETHELSPFTDSQSFQKYLILGKCSHRPNLCHKTIRESRWTVQLQSIWLTVWV